MPKEHPILFSTDMVKAILDGRKTMTRRVIKFQPEPNHIEEFKETWIRLCRYGQVGDRLWVRETFDYILGDEGDYLIYKAREDDYKWFQERKKDGSKITWKPSIFMPRWASRITLEITEVRVERVQEIKQSDLWREGIANTKSVNCEEAWRTITEFRKLWDSLNAKRGYSWDTNCWVWVISFRRLQ